MIINPVNGDIHDISSVEGKSILKKYIQNYNNGGSFDELENDELVANLFAETEPVKEPWERDAASITSPPPHYVEKRDRLRRFLNGTYRMFLKRWNRYLGETEEEKRATMELWKTPDTPENRKKVGEHIAYLTFIQEIDDTAVSEMIGGSTKGSLDEISGMDDPDTLRKIADFSPDLISALNSSNTDLRNIALSIYFNLPALPPISSISTENLSKTDLDALKSLDDLKDFLKRKRVEKKNDEGTVSSSIIKPVSNEGETLNKPTVRSRRSKRRRRPKPIFNV